MGLWGSARFHGYLLYDVHAVRGRGKRIAVSTGLFAFAQLQHQKNEESPIRTGRKKRATKPKSPIPIRCNIPREFCQEFRAQLASSRHLRFLVNNTEFTTVGDFPFW